MAKLRPSSQRWLKEHRDDPFVQRAKREGYRSRAAYKLLELQGMLHDKAGKVRPLIKPGAHVVELGAAPGGWTQVAVNLAGPEGRVLGVDLLEMDPVPGAEILQGDFLDQAVLDEIRARLPDFGRVDVVLSDMAPNMTGYKSADQGRGELLAECAFEFAEEALVIGGGICFKMFQGPGFDELVRRARLEFTQVKTVKPEASRSRSPELYLVGLDFKGAR
ncbi:RlmE family RNA methyltransferase [Magnetofaba australis]|uniref:Ribosomal RNA large subunit methyltransferase E n=1 Tax=Magnetofaba australis IT-1 TaxID=1434232 RepID=A0A1Y2K206_9PROT|nr:RlmE family RNA methyltransferase [Magnetofaba australis]OSM02081.1 putative ribosomal RNA methyltransferase RrmJ/FtsJ [Magnetofaba australis IT-1]